jgi:hypothetical protein
MSKVPLPERGQPIDLAYIYQLASGINDLATQLSPTTNRYTTIDTSSAGRQSVRTSDARIVGGYITVVNNSSTTPGSETQFSYTFSDFAYVPIITVSPILLEDSNHQAGKDVSVVLTRTTTNRLEGVVRFNTIGVATVGLNIIAVGIPV